MVCYQKLLLVSGEKRNIGVQKAILLLFTACSSRERKKLSIYL
jgi:hypothetical protein